MSSSKLYIKDIPNLICEWDWEKNSKIGLDPNKLSHGSTKYAFWLCSKGHSFKARIDHRCIMKSGCPACAHQVVTVGKNDLNTTHPHLAAEWDQTKNGDVTPSNVFAGSNKKYWWKCSEGHIWKAAVFSRASGRGCPTCAKENRVITLNKNLLEKRGSLLDTNPELAKQWHSTKNGNLTPSNVLAGSDRKVWWICQKGHEWEATISSRVHGNGCPECKKELSTSFPEQAIYYYLSKITNAVNRYKVDGFEIDIYLPSISVGIEYNGKYYHKNRQGKDENKVAELSKHGIRVIRIEEGEKNEIKGDIIFFKLINNNYTYLDFAINAILDIFSLPKISIDIKRDTPAIHQNYLTLEKTNSLASKYSWLIDEWNYNLNGTLTPWQIPYGSSKKVWWKCSKCNYEWEAVVYSRKKNGCPRCAGKVITPGYNDLTTLNPKLATEWDYKKNTILPTEISPNSHKKAWWKCSNGHSWQAEIKSRNQGCGCPICYKTKEKQ